MVKNLLRNVKSGVLRRINVIFQIGQKKSRFADWPNSTYTIPVKSITNESYPLHRTRIISLIEY
jgi:hypothetical protein